jgi:CHAT domain-containing protein
MQLENDRATSENVLEAMEKYGSVHLACHASQNLDQPTQSCFYLHDGSLTLADIAKKSLKNKGMAFLSACQTAAGDKQLPDEAIHLAAGMLVAGYPTVIATLWSISDRDAPLIADQFYEQLTKDGKLDAGRAARALHNAIGTLREQIGEKEFTRWVPYVHMGI